MTPLFGAIARLGSGEWAYAVTPLGFFVGCATVVRFFPHMNLEPAAHVSPILQAPVFLVLPAGLFVIVRLASMFVGTGSGMQPLRVRPSAAWGSRVWSPHTATTVIGIAFVVILLICGAWAYTDVLAELAHGMASSLSARIGLLIALLAGAVVGGVTAGRWRNTRVTANGVVRCFVGGVLMGWGSLLIPGSNDGLLLVGMPLLLPHAWVAFLTMCVVIAVAMLSVRSLRTSTKAAVR